MTAGRRADRDDHVDVAYERALAAIEALHTAGRQATESARRAATTRPAPPAPRSPAALRPLDADEWWARLSPDRREQIRRWITQRDRHDDEHVDGQLDVLDHLTDDPQEHL